MRLFGQAEHLSSITSHYTNPDGLFQAMDSRERSGLSFPALTALNLAHLKIDPIFLKQVLRERAKEGAKVKELKLRSIDGLGEEDLESLSAVVWSAHWDGQPYTRTTRTIAREYVE